MRFGTREPEKAELKAESLSSLLFNLSGFIALNLKK
jgi:hypothetical protein